MHWFGYKKTLVVAISIALLLSPIVGCAPEEVAPPPAGTIGVTPDSLELAFPLMLVVPINFSGTGWQPGEAIAIELVLPPGVEMKGVEPGENAPVAFAYADEEGNFNTSMEVTTKILTIFRGDLDLTREGNVVPESINPIPPGTYTIEAISVLSGSSNETTITFTAPEE